MPCPRCGKINGKIMIFETYLETAEKKDEDIPMYRSYIKRALDILLSLVGLILASWLFLIIILAIEIDDPGPVFFSQKRVGNHKILPAL